MISTRLSLVRHGHAGAARVDSLLADDLRPLTETGRNETRQIGLAMLALDFRPDRICVSPRSRSRQTGEILGSILDCPLRQMDALSHDALLPSEFLARLLEEASIGSPLFVGHDPLLSNLLSYLGCSLPGEWPKSAWVDLSRTDSTWNLRLFLSARACTPCP